MRSIDENVTTQLASNQLHNKPKYSMTSIQDRINQSNSKKRQVSMIQDGDLSGLDINRSISELR